MYNEITRFMRISSSISQTKNCAIRSNEIYDDDDDFAVMLNSNNKYYVFTKQIIFIVVIQSMRNALF